jgi:hypothetical protein
MTRETLWPELWLWELLIRRGFRSKIYAGPDEIRSVSVWRRIPQRRPAPKLHFELDDCRPIQTIEFLFAVKGANTPGTVFPNSDPIIHFGFARSRLTASQAPGGSTSGMLVIRPERDDW